MTPFRDPSLNIPEDATASELKNALKSLVEDGRIQDPEAIGLARALIERVNPPDISHMRDLFRTLVTLNAVVAFDVNEAIANVLQAPRLLSFTESRDFLRKHGIDLEKHREKAVKEAIRWGLIKQKEADNYGAKFDSVQLPRTDLEQLARQLLAEPNFKQRIIFGVDDMTPDDAWRRFIVDAGIKYKVLPGPTFSNGFVKIDPETKKPFANQEPTNKPGITFLDNFLELPPTFRGLSVLDRLNRMAMGEKYLGFNGWLIFFRQSLDECLRATDIGSRLDSLPQEQYKKLVEKAIADTTIYYKYIFQHILDTMSITHFPNLRRKTPNGMVVALSIRTNCVRLEDFSIYDDRNGFIGARNVLGTYLD